MQNNTRPTRSLSLSLSLFQTTENTACRLFFPERECQPVFFSLSSLLCKHKQQIGTFVLAFGLEHCMHHKYHSHHHPDEAHKAKKNAKMSGGHSPKEFSQTTSLDEITKE